MNPEDFYNLTSNFDEPIVFKEILKWKILSWSLQDWCSVLKKDKLAFRRIPFIRTEVCLKRIDFITFNLISFLRNQFMKHNVINFF